MNNRCWTKYILFEFIYYHLKKLIWMILFEFIDPVQRSKSFRRKTDAKVNIYPCRSDPWYDEKKKNLIQGIPNMGKILIYFVAKGICIFDHKSNVDGLYRIWWIPDSFIRLGVPRGSMPCESTADGIQLYVHHTITVLPPRIKTMRQSYHLLLQWVDHDIDLSAL